MDYLKIDCPCCTATLMIDPKLKRVLSHEKKKLEHDSLEEFFVKEKQKEKKLDQVFEEGKQKEKSKLDFLAKKFDLAKKQKKQGSDNEQSSNQRIFWD